MTEKKGTKEQAPAQASFSLETLYVKDMSFESPNSPQVFLEQEQPELDIDIDIQHSKLEKGDLYEVILPLSVEARVGDKTLFLAEVHQAGLFQISGVDEASLPMVLEINCANILLPFARETIASMIGHGGFPPVLVNPVNFELLFQQRHTTAKEATS
ncbi:MAG: protein-export chaperone SecB [Acidiferrobacterales bacterium]